MDGLLTLYYAITSIFPLYCPLIVLSHCPYITDSVDQKHFSELEDTANSLIAKASDLKDKLNVFKSGSREEKDALLLSLRSVVLVYEIIVGWKKRSFHDLS